MKVKLTGNFSQVLTGTRLLQSELGFELSDVGHELKLIRQSTNVLKVEERENCTCIYFREPSQYYRGLAKYFQKKGCRIYEVPQFDTCGVMIDCSRNAVPKVSSLKFLIRKLALLGLNTLLLYLEDTYELKEYPYFGYMRGRYSQKELQECDDYAALFGIEIIPCIQTLGHLKEALKWDYANQMKDTEDILLVGEGETYRLIEEMLKTMSQTFRSKKVHIGMDEAHQLGLGKSLAKHGFQNRFDLMNQHLSWVTDICRKYQLEPMIWSDMYFRLGAKGRYYAPDVVFPQKVLANLPDIKMVYWDYYHNQPHHYEKMIQKHHELTDDIVFAGGIWTWNGMVPNFGKTFTTTEAALSACKRTGITEVFATVWGDNGAETPFISIYPGLVLYGEHCWQKKVDQTELEESLSFVFKASWNDFMLLRQFDEVPSIAADNPYESSPSKFLLWQDIMMGLYDQTVAGIELTKHYGNLYQQLSHVKGKTPEQRAYFDYYRQFAKVLREKSELGLRLKEAYAKENRTVASQLQQKIQDLIPETSQLRKLHRKLWLLINKPFGWEVMDLRYSGLIGRLETADFRITQWLTGEISQLDELEEERLPFVQTENNQEGTLGGNVYHRIVSAGALF